ncbi:GGDEF domain-containing protein [Alkalibacter rhizosphaerae]|uniref:GGDEF domain-containing protein n=1 Tax=Alkalibacter rhizosphaerae TaxID=2815577 RepID=A0A975AGY2_9FIRM|nr:sensor domain-containing diguanylate cyclase [Alkalibacter rhizosphaerae]QSX07867.1 GGDEF domain-containing protein [Alkalibacter rhizosphaerae]
MNNKKFIEQEFYRFIFENSMDAIFLTSPDGAIHRANPAACRMFEMTEEELVKAGRAGIVDLEDPRLEAGLKEREEKGFVFAELTYIKKDGTRFPGQVTSTIFHDENGSPWTAMIVRDVTHVKQTKDALLELQKVTEDMASRDYLTGVLNRRGFVEKLKKEVSRLQREKGQLTLMMIDIDYFKAINDQYGHLQGDALLIEFADRLKKLIRPYDEIGRYGGDEFILMMPNTGEADALLAAERIRLVFKNDPIKTTKKKIPITLSIGVSVYTHEDGRDLTSMLSKVDDNMYRAKEKRDFVYAH